MIEIIDNKIYVKDNLTIKESVTLLNKATELRKYGNVTVDTTSISFIDSSGTATLSRLKRDRGIDLILSDYLKSELEKFDSLINYELKHSEKKSILEQITEKIYSLISGISYFAVLSADIFYYSFKSIFNSSGRRKGSVYEQIILMGNNAVPIVLLLSSLIGLILSLQSAQQLKQFGANIFLVDLVVISMISEMGPMITAIIVAGRSGSSISAEIATMKITEELDALKVMALHPMKYVVSPKMLAITVSLPLLTIAANAVGIFGGFVIAVLYLDLNPQVFIDRAFSVMTLKMWLISLTKSVIFSWLILIIGVFFGFTVKGGADGVGRSTTASVVASIFAVIVADALLSIVFYFKF